MTARQCLACLGVVALAALLLTHSDPARAGSCELKMGPYASPSAADLAVQQAKSIGYNTSGVWGEGGVVSQLVSRFRSSHALAATSDANFGIKGTLATL